MQSEVISLFERLLQLTESLLQQFQEKNLVLSDLSSIHQLMFQRGQLIDDLMVYPYYTLCDEEKSAIEQKIQTLQALDPQLQSQFKEMTLQVKGYWRELVGTKSVIAHYK